MFFKYLKILGFTLFKKEKFLLSTFLEALSHPRYLSLRLLPDLSTCNSFFVYFYLHLLKEDRILFAVKFLKYF